MSAAGGSRRTRRLAAIVLATSRICWLCGHDGATQADHIIAKAKRPDLEFDLGNLAPAHGQDAPCPTCGRKCNQIKGDGDAVIDLNCSRDWYAAVR